MPPLIPQPGVLKAEIHFQVAEDHNVSTRQYFSYTGTAPADSVCATIAEAVGVAWRNAWLGHLSNESSQNGCTVQDLSTPTSGYGVDTLSAAGTATGAILPASAAQLMNYTIARRYRGGKPRAYWPVHVAADLSDPQTWDPGVLATMTTEWQTSFLDVLLGSSYSGTTLVHQVNVSYYEGFTPVQNPITLRWKNVAKPRTVAIAPDVITGFVLNSKPGSQRRRQLHSA